MAVSLKHYLRGEASIYYKVGSPSIAPRHALISLSPPQDLYPLVVSVLLPVLDARLLTSSFSVSCEAGQKQGNLSAKTC